MFILQADPVAFSIGGWNIYWYGIIYAGALFSSWIIATWILRKLRYNDIRVPTKAEFDSFMFWAIIAVLVGARLGHVLFFELEYFLNHPKEILMLRNGGLSFHGSVIGLGLYSFFYIKKHNLSWKMMADTLCFASTLGLGVGRLANFINQELYGKICTSDFAIIFKFVDEMPRYPTQIFESFFEGFLNFWIIFVAFRLKGVKLIGGGVVTSIFCIVYSSSRFIIEFFKEVETYTYFNFITLTVGQILSITMFLFGIFMLYYKENDSPKLNVKN